MAKLYRLIPDSIATKYETHYMSDISEDLFYKLGYISINDHVNNYFCIRNEGNSWHKNTKDEIFFFFSPWDCLANLLYLNDFYGIEVARVFEYDVDDKIIKKCPQGYGYYRNIAYKEVKIPITLLNSESIINTELTNELKTKLIEICINDINDSFKYLKESVKTNTYSKLEAIKNYILDDNLEKDYFNSESMEKGIARRLENCGNFFKSNIITGKSILITRAQRNLFFDFLNNSENYSQQIYELCENSNQIFTIDNLIEFNEKYGVKELNIKSNKKTLI